MSSEDDGSCSGSCSESDYDEAPFSRPGRLPPWPGTTLILNMTVF